MKRRRVLGLVAGTLLVSGAIANAGQEPAPGSALARRVARLAARANLGGASAPAFDAAAVRVIGVAWQDDGTAVPYPQLQIRNLENGQVVARTTGTESGEFSFDGLAEGVYVIELLDEDGRVVDVGQPMVLASGQTFGMFLSSPAVARSFAGGGGAGGGFTPGVDETAADQPTTITALSSGGGLFSGAAPRLVETAVGARVPAVGGGRAASNES